MKTLVVCGAETPSHLLERLKAREHDVATRAADELLDGDVGGFDLVLLQCDTERAGALARALLARGCSALLFLVGEPESTRALEQLLASGITGYVVDAGPACDFSIACAEKAGREREEIARLAATLRVSEAQLRMADRLAAVGRLAATVGHEINNPLAYVIGNLDALAARGLTPGSETARLVNDARDGADRVRRIVRDLKAFARNESDGVGPVDVRRVLDSTISIASNEIRHRARLVRDFGDVRAVVANESRLGQVFLNLLVNAAQATRAGDVQANEIRVTTRATGDRVTIEIRDTGVGIPPDLLDRIFDPYFTTRSDAVGTGLGLSICHSLVTGIGGTIEVESEVGRGSVFRVALPASDEMPREQSLPPSSASALERKQRILIVDDEPRLAVTLKMLLRDHDVEVADGGRRALERIDRDRAFDVLLCDLMMVDVDGVDVYERVRAAVPGLEKRIIFMTGGAFTSRASEFLASIPNVCLEKPFQVDELLRAVRRTLKDFTA